MADVVTLEASLKLLDEVSPSISAMEKVLQEFEDQLGVTRKEIEETRATTKMLSDEDDVLRYKLEQLGITYEEYNAIVQKSNDALIAAAREMDKMQNEAEKMNTVFDRSAAAMDKAQMEALRMNKAFDEAADAANRAHGPIEELFRAMSSGTIGEVIEAFKGLPAILGVAGEAIHVVTESVEKLAARGEFLANKSLISGIQIEKLQVFERAAHDAGGSLDQLTRAATQLGRAADANKDIFKRMGIDPKELKAKDSAEQLEFLAKKLFEIESPAQRSTAAMALFGRSGAQMLPTLKALAEGAGELKVALSGDQITALAALDDSIDAAKGGFSDLKEQLTAIIATSPFVKAAIDKIGEAFRDVANWIKNTLSPAITVLQGQWADVMAMMEEKSRETNAKVIGDLDKLIAQGKKVNDVYSGLGVGTLVKFGAETGKAINEAKLGGKTLEEMRDGLKKQNEELDKSATKWQDLATKMISGDAAAKQAADGTDKLTDKLTAAEKAHLKLIETLAKGLGGDKAQTQADNLAEALEKIGGLAEVEDIPKLAAQILKLEDAGAKTSPELHQLAEATRDAAGAARDADQAWKDAAESTAKWNEVLDKIDINKFQDMKNTLAQLGAAGKLGEIPVDKIKGMAEGFIKAKDAGEDLSPEMDQIIERFVGIREEEQRVIDESAAWAAAAQKHANEVSVANFKAQQTFAKWGQLFQGAIGLAGLFGETAAQAATLAGNSFNEFTNASKLSTEANAMPGNLIDMSDAAAVANASTQDLEKTEKTTTAQQAKFNAQVNAGAAAAGLLGGVLEKSTNPNLQKAGAAMQGAAQGAKLGAGFGPYGVVIGAVAGAIVGWIRKSKQMREEMKKLKAAFLEQHGGMEKLSAEAKAAGVNLDKAFKAKTPQEMKKQMDIVNKQLDAFNGLLEVAGGSIESLKGLAADAGISLQAIWDAKTPEEYLAAVENVKKSLDDWNNASSKLNAAMDKYGISVDQLGGKFKQAGMDKIGLGMLESFSLLKAAGADVGLITEKMSADMSDYVNRAVKAGATVPEAMRPMIEEMIKNGDLLDENGKAYDSLTDAGITFAQTLEEGVASAVDAINKLVAVLAQGFNIPVDVHPAGGGGGGGGNQGGGAGQHGAPDENSFAGGSDGFRDFGRGTPATLHGLEAVVRPMDLQSAIAGMMERGGITGRGGDTSTVVNLAISENPMQTAETVERMREFTLDTVEKEVARSLADAISRGQA